MVCDLEDNGTAMHVIAINYQKNKENEQDFERRQKERELHPT